jgi:tetratricopeptide (TPR) repeat protein
LCNHFQLYSKAIAEDDAQADFYANRANAYLKLDKNEEAVKDATQALTLNPKHSRALLRKG